MRRWRVFLNVVYDFGDLGYEDLFKVDIPDPLANLEDVIAMAYEHVAENSNGYFDYIKYCDIVNVMKYQPLPGGIFADFREVDLGDWA